MAGEHLAYVMGHQTRAASAAKGGLGKHGHGRYKNNHGYMYVRFNTLPEAEQERFDSMKIRYCAFEAIAEHRLVMARAIGRPLVTEENVHHKNGKRHDNRPENLELWASKQPPRQRVGDVCPWCDGTGLAPE